MDDFSDLKMEDAPKPAFPKRWNLWQFTFWRLVKQFWIALVIAVWGVLCYLLITHFVILSVEVDGSSMFPTLKNSGRYWLNRLAYVHSEPHRLDIVVLKDPQDGILVVKRIIAMPGQSIYFNKGKVYLDGKLLAEPYLPDKTYTFAYERKSGDEFICVGRDEYYVMGDNRGNSTDSRVYGTVPRKNILGKLFLP